MDKVQIGIAIGIGVSGFLLYSRKSKWFKPQIVLAICGILFGFGLVGLLTQKPFDQKESVLFVNFCIPLLYFSLDRFLKYLSIKKYNRDFILWLRWSSEIDGRLGAENPHVKIHDKLISIGLLCFIVVLVIVASIKVPELLENNYY